MNTLTVEVNRLARRQINQVVMPLIATIRQQRDAIARLTERVAALEKEKAKPAEPTVPGVSDQEMQKARFSGDLIKRLRKKLKLGRDKFGKLLGVSGYAVFAWENDTCKPSAPRKRAIVALRKMGKREVKELVKAGKSVVAK